jgi:hypothetical protein
MEVNVEYYGEGSIAYVLSLIAQTHARGNANADGSFANDFPFRCKPRSERAKALFIAALEL